MLRVDNKIEFVKLRWSLSTWITGRYTLRSGKRIYRLRWNEQKYQALLDLADLSGVLVGGQEFYAGKILLHDARSPA